MCYLNNLSPTGLNVCRLEEEFGISLDENVNVDAIIRYMSNMHAQQLIMDDYWKVNIIKELIECRYGFGECILSHEQATHIMCELAVI